MLMGCGLFILWHGHGKQMQHPPRSEYQSRSFANLYLQPIARFAHPHTTTLFNVLLFICLVEVLPSIRFA